VITAVLGTQQDRIDAQLHRTPTSSRPRTTATRIGIPKSRINRADLIYEHLKGREDEVIGRITRLLRTSRPIRRLAVDPWPGPVMQARIASRSLVVVAPLEHVDSQNKEQQCRPSVSEVVHRIGALAMRLTSNQAEQNHSRAIHSTPRTPRRPRCASILFLSRIWIVPGPTTEWTRTMLCSVRQGTHRTKNSSLPIAQE
jgi:hypothetical protein